MSAGHDDISYARTRAAVAANSRPESEEIAAEAAERLATDTPVERVRQEKFSWLTRKVLIESRNDQFAKMIHDLVLDDRPRWIATQKAAGAERGREDFVVPLDRGDFTMIVVGDPGEGDLSQWAVAETLAVDGGDPARVPELVKKSDFLLVMSDVVYPAGDVNEYAEKFYAPFEGYPRPIYALPGNHDWYDGLDGFMFHFCAAEPLPAVTYRASSYPIREWLARLLWRRPSRPDRARLLGLRNERPPWRDDGRCPQPAPYFVMKTEHLALVCIDTGINGTVDHEQGEWLLRVSDRVPGSKVLLTGKPLYVDAEYRPCPIEWGDDREWPRYVDDVVRDPKFGYVAAIGGDIHNYQRYPVTVPGKEEDRTIQYVVSGGGGAYMSETHTIPLGSELRDREDRHPIDEGDLRLYPLRGHSLAMITHEFIRRARGFVGAALALLVTGEVTAAFLWNSKWNPKYAGLVAVAIGVLQLVWALLSAPVRRRRVVLYALGVLALGGAIYLLHAVAGKHAVTVVLAIATVAVPLLMVSFSRKLKKYAFEIGGLILVGLLANAVSEEGLRHATRTALGAMLFGALCLIGVGLQIQRTKPKRPQMSWAPPKPPLRTAAKVWGMVVVVAAVLAVLAFLGFMFFDDSTPRVVAVAVAALGLVPLGYAAWLGLPRTLLRLWQDGDLRSKVDDGKWLSNQAAKFCAQRLGTDPLSDSAAKLAEVDPRIDKIFEYVFPKEGGLQRYDPLHVFIAEILDSDEPPFAKNYLALSVSNTGGQPLLDIHAFGVDGLGGKPEEIDAVPGIPLAAAATRVLAGRK